MSVALLLCAAMLGCSLSRPAPIKQSYLLHASRPAGTQPRTLEGALRVNRFTVAQSFNGRAMVYRADDARFEVDFYNEFLALPATMMTERATAWLASARLFSAVVPMTSGIDTQYVLEAEVTDFYGDFRDAAQPRAVLAARFYLARDPSAQVLYERTIDRSIPLAARSAAGLVAGFDRALGEMLVELEADLAKLTPTATKASP